MLTTDSMVDAEEDMAGADMLRIDSTAEAEMFPKRNGWLRYACSKFDPAPKKPVKLPFIEKPVKTIPSEMVGYMLTRAYVWAEPKEWLGRRLGPTPSKERVSKILTRRA